MILRLQLTMIDVCYIVEVIVLIAVSSESWLYITVVFFFLFMCR